MTKYIPRHRLLLDYDKICPICIKRFYSKRVNAKYCSIICKKKALKEQQRINSERCYKMKKINPREKNVNISLKIHKKLKLRAMNEDKALKDLINEILEKEIKSMEKK